MLSLAEWLARVGFTEGNPFALKWAEDERERLNEYFVEHPAYHAVIDQEAPRSGLLHGPRGAGKSCTRRMFEAHCQTRGGSAYAALVRLNDWMPVVERAGGAAVGPRDLLDEILRLFVVALAELPATPGRPLPPDEAGYLRWIGRSHGSYLRPSQRGDLEARGWLAPRDTPAPEPDPYSLTERSVLQVIQLLAGISAAAGCSVCYLVLDGVDELCATSADWDAGADLLAPLLGNIRLLEVPGFAVKGFVPSEVVAVLRARRLLREDRLATFELAWSRDQLCELLRSRLMAFSDGALESLAMIADPELADIDEQLCLAATGSPRHLLNLGDLLLQACARTADDSDLLLRQTHLRAALAQHTGRHADGARTAAGHAPGDAAPATPRPSRCGDEGVPPLRLDPDGSVYRGAERLPDVRRLTALQRRLLEYLYEHRGRLCTSEELIAYVWAGRTEPSDKDSLRRLADRLVELIEPEPRAPVYLERPYGGFFVLRHTAL